MIGSITNALRITLFLVAVSAQSKYQIARHQSNWFEASEHCHRLGMHLAIIDSEEKHNDVVREAKAVNLRWSGFFGGWLGATDLAQAKNFIWHNTGMQLRYTRWAEGEPTGLDERMGADEHCVALYYWPAEGFNWTWNDAPCNSELYAICENVDRVSCIEPF